MEYLWLIAGFALLVVGADIFVEGSSAIAKLFKIPSTYSWDKIKRTGIALWGGVSSISSTVFPDFDPIDEFSLDFDD